MPARLLDTALSVCWRQEKSGIKLQSLRQEEKKSVHTSSSPLRVLWVSFENYQADDGWREFHSLVCFRSWGIPEPESQGTRWGGNGPPDHLGKPRTTSSPFQCSRPRTPPLKSWSSENYTVSGQLCLCVFVCVCVFKMFYRNLTRNYWVKHNRV